MKIVGVPSITTGCECHICKDRVFAMTTPFGGEFTTCPLCGGFNEDHNYVVLCKPCYEKNDCDNCKCKEGLCYDYCDKCGIVYDIGTTHRVMGCTDNIFYGCLITSFVDGGNHVNGMPVFESREEAERVLNILDSVVMSDMDEYYDIKQCRGLKN